MIYLIWDSENWYFLVSAGNGGRELSPSSANSKRSSTIGLGFAYDETLGPSLCGGFARKGEGSGEKRQLAYGCTESPIRGGEQRAKQATPIGFRYGVKNLGVPAYLQVTGYPNKELPS